MPIGAAVVSGIETARVLHEQGFQATATESGIRIAFPYDRVAESIAGGVDDDSDIECVEVSLDPTWRVFDSAGSFRESAEQIARFGVSRTATDPPGVDGALVIGRSNRDREHAQRAQHHPAEYLEKPGRPRPLSLAVFGPPGSGKSFAIKQMASVITPHHNPLGSLEFNLSSFAMPTSSQPLSNKFEICACGNTSHLSFGTNSIVH